MTKTFYILALGLISTNAMAQTQAYSEDFQNGIPANYTIVNADGFTPAAAVSDFSEAWILLADPANPSDSIMGSTSYFDPAGQANRWLITPQITLGAYGNSLFWDAKSHDPSYLDGYYVLASKTDTAVASFTDTLFSVSGESSEWTYREVNLSESGLDNETVHIAFVNRTNDGFKLYIDSISVMKDDPVGLSSNAPFTVGVYPNPTNGKVMINGDFEIAKIYSPTGSLIAEFTDSTIDLSAYHSGIYLIHVFKGDKVFRTRIVKTL